MLSRLVIELDLVLEGKKAWTSYKDKMKKAGMLRTVLDAHTDIDKATAKAMLKAASANALPAFTPRKRQNHQKPKLFSLSNPKKEQKPVQPVVAVVDGRRGELRTHLRTQGGARDRVEIEIIIEIILSVATILR